MLLKYKSLGSGPPLIICHGLFGMLDNWQTLGRKWSEDFTVYLVDLRNHGKSPHDSELTYSLMAQDLIELLTSLGISKAHFLGHSMGAKVVMQLALTNPEFVDKIIAVDMGVMRNVPRHNEIFEALEAFSIDTIKTRKEADEYLEAVIPDRGVRQFLLKNLKRNSDGSFHWKMNLESIIQNYSEILAPMPDSSFAGKTLFIKGKQANYLPEELDDPILKRFPSAELVTLDTGHWVHAEKPIEMHSIVKAFLLAD